MYNHDPSGREPFDLDLTLRRKPIGHVIATRITAENPNEGFKPNGGKLHCINFSPFNGTWGYFSVQSDGCIHDFSDSQFGHIFSQGSSRLEACKLIVETLKSTRISAEFRTNLGYVSGLVEHDNFQNNQFSTSWLDGLIADKFLPYSFDIPNFAICAAVVLGKKKFEQSHRIVMDSLHKRHYPNKDLFSNIALIKFIANNNIFEFAISLSSSDSFIIKHQNHQLPVKFCQSEDKLLIISFNHQNYVVQQQDNDHCLRMIINGIDWVVEFENDPSSVRAPSSGRIVKFLVEDGSKVEKDAAIAEIEVMKMYLPIHAQGTGFITFKRSIGSSIQAGDLIASIDIDDKNLVSEISKFNGKFFELGSNSGFRNSFEIYTDSMQAIERSLLGYESINLDHTISLFLDSCLDPNLVLFNLQSVLSAIRSKVPLKLLEEVLNLISIGISKQEALSTLQKIETVLASTIDGNLGELIQLIKPHSLGPINYALSQIKAIVQDFSDCESFFASELTSNGPLCKLLDVFGSDYVTVSKYIRKHYQLDSRTTTILRLIDELIARCPILLKNSEFINLIKNVASLAGKEYTKVRRRMREILLISQLPSLDHLYRRIEVKLESGIKIASDKGKRADFVNEMVEGFETHLDVIPRFFHHENPEIKRLALEIYTRRVFAAYVLRNTKFSKDGKLFEWNFSTQPQDDLHEGHHRRRPSSAAIYPIVGISSAESYGAKMDQLRKGYMISLDDLLILKEEISSILVNISGRSDEEPNHLYLVGKERTGWNDDETAEYIQNIIKGMSRDLGTHRVRRITVAVVREKVVSVGFYTFSQSRDFKEDKTIRNIEPAMAYLLEFPRLCNYDIEFCYADPTGQVRIYLGTERNLAKNQRIFIRLIIRPNQAMREFTSMVHFAPEAYRILEEVLQAVETVQAKYRQTFDYNHLFINIVPVFYNKPSDVHHVMQQLIAAYKGRWTELRIRQAEVRMSLADSKDSTSCRYRFCMNNEACALPLVQGYQEQKDPLSGFKYLISMDGRGPLDGFPVTFHYPHMTSLQVKRTKVLSLETPYVYDFPSIFENTIAAAWKSYHFQGGELITPNQLLEYEELIWDSTKNSLTKVNRPAGLNNIGMVAWQMTIFTPEAPTGRKIIVIANDISFEIGSFGVAEDKLFHEASLLARKAGLPRIYLSANSGARIGLADELRTLIKVAWKNPQDPTVGFDYLYLEKEDFEGLKPGTVNCKEEIGENGQIRYKIIDVIGAKHGLGVENLQGSAMIAGETSRAYEDIFTLSLVTCRSVGIGAYLVRLGQRIIQKYQHPIILTGVGALNNLLGREVYENNLQIGGPQVMFANGVSHRIVQDDMEGIQEIINWLSFVPIKANCLPPIMRTRDNPVRSVTFEVPSDGLYDPRSLIEGRVQDGIWLSGLFDRGSFIETLGGWAKTVITGRARLGGYPVGVIAVEVRTVDLIIPADPANLSSTAQSVKQAGQVWFPDSAFKTAQAIRDFSNGENLPIFILANWRGFSGGQRDLYEQVLKFGAMIVDALKDVKQPVFVYLPPGSELRGGAWVVVDSQINSNFIEMYADPTARGGILEPEGIVGVKFRQHHLHSLMERLDPICQALIDELENSTTPTEKDEISKKLSARRAKLLPIFRQIACHFADAHDRPGRMKAKNVIREIVPWSQSRAYFYHRLRRLLAEAELIGLVKGYRLNWIEKKTKLSLLLLNNFNIDLSSVNDESIFDKLSEHNHAIKNQIKELNISLAKSEISRIVSDLSSDFNFNISDVSM